MPRPASDDHDGIHFGADPTVDPFITIGNANNSGGWPGTGSPAGTPGAVAIYKKFGTNDGVNTPIPKSTQALFVVAPYFGPTADDSAEAASASVILSDTGTPYTQAKQTIAFEGTSHIQDGVTASAVVSGVAGRVEVAGVAAQAVSVRASAQTTSDSDGAITTYIAFGQLATPAYGTITNKWGLYVADRAHSEVGISAGAPAWTGQAKLLPGGNADSAVSLFVLKGPDSAPGLTTLSLVQGTGQTRALMEARDSSGNTRFALGVTGVARFSGVVTNWTDGSNNVRMTMDLAVGLTFADGRNIIAGTATGTKIGTATAQKLGFWNATPVVQPSGTPAAATDLATALTLVNDLRSKLLTLGLAA